MVWWYTAGFRNRSSGRWLRLSISEFVRNASTPPQPLTQTSSTYEYQSYSATKRQETAVWMRSSNAFNFWFRWSGNRSLFKTQSILLEVCLSSFIRGHPNLPCTVPSLTDDPRRQSWLSVIEEIDCPSAAVFRTEIPHVYLFDSIESCLHSQRCACRPSAGNRIDRTETYP